MNSFTDKQDIKVAPPVIGIYPSALIMMQRLVELNSPLEISWCATVENKNGMPVITEVLYPYGGEHSSGRTNITAAMAKYCHHELYMKGKKDKIEKNHCWVHSHHTMTPIFFSPRDDKTIVGKEEGTVCAHWQISIVMNIYQEYKMTVSIYDAYGLPLDIRFDYPANTGLKVYPYGDPIAGPEAVLMAEKMWRGESVDIEARVKELFEKTGPGPFIPEENNIAPQLVKNMEEYREKLSKNVVIDTSVWNRIPFLKDVRAWWIEWNSKRREAEEAAKTSQNAPNAPSGTGQPLPVGPSGVRPGQLINPPTKVVSPMSAPDGAAASQTATVPSAPAEEVSAEEGPVEARLEPVVEHKPEPVMSAAGNAPAESAKHHYQGEPGHAVRISGDGEADPEVVRDLEGDSADKVVPATELGDEAQAEEEEIHHAKEGDEETDD